MNVYCISCNPISIKILKVNVSSTTVKSLKLLLVLSPRPPSSYHRKLGGQCIQLLHLRLCIYQLPPNTVHRGLSQITAVDDLNDSDF